MRETWFVFNITSHPSVGLQIQVRIKKEVLDEDVKAGRAGLMGGGLSGDQWYVQQVRTSVGLCGVGWKGTGSAGLNVKGRTGDQWCVQQVLTSVGFERRGGRTKGQVWERGLHACC